ncbi:asparaginase [Angustibacter sp. McL0619]|uniref:asparaginase n=1 Tax=Angustibacter sp. McL0619 TaxID=3415676 RepID=UPI003CF31DB6
MPDVPLAHVVRSGFVESVHHGSVVVLGPDGEVLASAGDPKAPIFARSSNKLAQAAAMLRSGLDLDGELLALAAASHSGEAFHLAAAQRILAGAGLTEADLQNTPDLPHDDTERRAWIAAGRRAVPLAQNCSGKHAAMLATCVAAGWDTASYRDADHPLQAAIADTLTELAGEPVVATGTDGCGAPVMAQSLTGLARSFRAMATAAATSEAGRVAAAVRAYPEYLGGSRRDVTTLIRAVPGLIAKDGAEAVFAAALDDGRAVALKIADGGQRARPVVMAEALRLAGVASSDVQFLRHAPVLGHGQPVGAVVALPLG